MASIEFILRDGSVRTIAANDGASLMEAAIHNNVKGIDAECGGCCACATCHVHVDPAWAGKLPPPDEMESETLDAVSGERTDFSRLSCQITVGPALDGLVVRIPAA